MRPRPCSPTLALPQAEPAISTVWPGLTEEPAIGPAVVERWPPQKIYLPATCECDLIWKKIHCRCNSVKEPEMRPFWITFVGPNSNDKCPYWTRKHTEEKAMWAGGRDCSDVYMLRMGSSHQKLGQRHEITNCCCFYATPFVKTCYSSPRKWIRKPCKFSVQR